MMIRNFLLSFICFIATVMCSVSPLKKNTVVLQLNDANFNSTILQHERFLLQFYATWCGPCASLLPQFEKAAQELKNENIHFGIIDGVVNNATKLRYNVKNYPTLLFFNKGEITFYTGGRKSHQIVNWIRHTIAFKVPVFTNPSEVEEFNKNNIVTIVLFGNAENYVKSFEAVARQLHEKKFAICASDDCINFYKVKKHNVVVFQKGVNFQQYSVGFSSDYQKLLYYFILNFTSQKISSYNLQVADQIFKFGNPAIFFILDHKSIDDSNAKLNELANNVADNHNNLAVVLTDMNDELDDYKLVLCDKLGVKESELPVVVIVDTREGMNKIKKYKKLLTNEELTYKQISSFIDLWRTNKLSTYIVSEEVSEEDKTKTVKKVVGHNFNDFINDESKDVLMFFTRPNCFHCGLLTPRLEEFAKELLRLNPYINVGVVDTSKNEVEINPDTYPNFKLFKRGQKKSPITFNKTHDTSGFNAFLAENLEPFIPVPDKQNTNSTIRNSTGVYYSGDKEINEEDLRKLTAGKKIDL